MVMKLERMKRIMKKYPLNFNKLRRIYDLEIELEKLKEENEKLNEDIQTLKVRRQM